MPAQGLITLAEHPGGLTVAAAHAALHDRSRSYPELAVLDVMSANLRWQLMRCDRDLTGGVPEED